MNNITPYIPTKGQQFKNVTGKGSKGFDCKILPDGTRIPNWVEQLGGFENTINLIEMLIKNNYDRVPLAKYLNINQVTCKKFIKKYLSEEVLELENQIFKQNAHLRRSLHLKGRPSKLKGKTYKEIYGDKPVECGFRKGDQNPNFTRDKYIGCTVVNNSGKRFRSSYEAKFSNLLEEHNIPYNYEHHYKLCNGKVKIVDFVVNGKLVEITGYAYEKWKNDFDVKIQLLSKTYPDLPLIIISTKDRTEELTTKHRGIATILDLHDPNLISYL
jgi:hypothetical protein